MSNPNSSLHSAKRTIIIYSLLIIAIFTNSIVGQTAQMRFDNISIREGLPHNNIHHISQDHLGFIWLCSPAGLYRYDGYDIKQFIPSMDDSSKILTYVRQTLSDNLGNLWIATNSGLFKFDHNTQSYSQFVHVEGDTNSIITDGIFTLFESKDNTLWVGTIGHGMEIYNRENNTFSHYRHNPNDSTTLSSDAVNSICEDLLGNIWIGTSNGLNKLNRETRKFTRYYHEQGNINSIDHNTITNLLVDNSGLLWIITWTNVQIYNPYNDSFSYLDVGENELRSLRENRVTTISEDQDNNIWLGTEHNGILLYDVSEEKLYNIQNINGDPKSICGNRILTIFSDRFGSVWVGTFLSGISKFSKSKYKFGAFNQRRRFGDNPENNSIYAIYQDKEGKIWMGTYSNGINVFDPSLAKISNFRFSPNTPFSIGSNYVNNFYEDKKGDLWISTFGGGLHKLVGLTDEFAKFKRYQHIQDQSTSISSNSPTAIYEDNDNNFWIGTYGGGLNLFNRNTERFKNYRHNPDDSTTIAEDIIWVIYEDSKNNLWIGTDQNGLELFDRQKEIFNHYLNYNNTTSTILAIEEDKKGRLWLGTYYEGLLLFDKEYGVIDKIDSRNGLPSNSVKSIIEDDYGLLWVTTEYALTKVDYDNNIIKNYDVSDGLHSGNFNLNAYYKGKDNKIFLGGSEGFNTFSPGDLVDNNQPPQIVLISIKIFNETLQIDHKSPLKMHLNSTEKIELGYNQNDISIEYAALHYVNPEKNEYKYFLENYDTEWRQVGDKRIATYTSLNPGVYRFKVTAANSDGYWNENPRILKIIIHPPIWQTSWFRILAVIIIFSLLYYAYKKRINILQSKKKELEERVKERTEAAEKLNKALNEVETLKNRLQSENIYLQDEINIVHNFENIICQSDEMKKVLQNVEKVSSTEATVLILGETGTGKELIARAIHSVSPRSNRPLVKVNCAALPENLIESELFGHEKGAFTGAVSQKIGKFELAHGGTIFLDEIGDLPLNLQTKLLRVLQEGEIDRVGGTKSINVDVRVIAATNRILERAIERKEFREDLFYRLNVFPINIPPLRNRKEDIPPLVKYFMEKYNVKAGKNVELVSKNVMDILIDYTWPGNIRELENIIERAIILSNGKSLIIGDWLKKSPIRPPLDSRLRGNDKRGGFPPEFIPYFRITGRE
ncbi:MAG: sigma 54-interacting transcriptional regulator, partial [Melioribacteraceae bacterium]|nr:sigma 54-interacting transcriptional regulator [Melioribacteraceae bacterium]